jgi:hydrogenase nickel incorporation protein HypA/HybF
MADLIRRAEDLAAAEGAIRVVEVRVRLGGLSEISDEHLREHFAVAAEGTMLDGARINIEIGPTGDDALTDPDARGVLLMGLDMEID